MAGPAGTQINEEVNQKELEKEITQTLIKFYTADTIFVVLIFNFQIWKYLPIVAKSLLSTPSTACQSPSACMIARSSAYTYFLAETVFDKSEVWILKKGVQRRILLLLLVLVVRVKLRLPTRSMIMRIM